MSRPFFIVSAARSGSTSLARILDSGSNVVCRSEPVPTLGRESRAAREGRLADRSAIVSRVIGDRVANVEPGFVYGEKNVTLAPFLAELSNQFDANVVRLTRDGRHVVTSLMTWHSSLFGSIYREAASEDPLTIEARTAAARLLAIDDESDYARHRPLDGMVGDRPWLDLSRFEMCCWYWSAANEELRRVTEGLPVDRVHDLDYSSVSPEDVLKLGHRLAIVGLDGTNVSELLESRINSVGDRGASNQVRHPTWTEWDSGQRDSFEALCDPMMSELGYWSPGERWRPNDFGSFWESKGPDVDWFEWMYEHRRSVHDDLLALVRRNSGWTSFCDVGCGIALHYAHEFRDRRYRGIDVSEPSIEWCREHRQRSQHDFVVADVCDGSSTEIDERFDLVFSQGTIDNVHDMDGFLRGMLHRSKGSIYVTAYRGWFPELSEHRYSFNPEHGCFYNDLSPQRVERVLADAGATSIDIGPVATGHPEIPYETRIVAKAPS